MLPPIDSLKQDILNLSPTDDPVQGIQNFVKVIANYVNQVQGGAAGSPGIFKFNESIMVALLTTLQPVSDNSWALGFTNAFQAGCNAAIITPATVQNPAWSGSGSLDIVTLPTGIATIPTLLAACQLLQSGLTNAQPDDNAPISLTKGIHDAVSAFTFICIGLGPAPALPPIPIPTPAA